VTITSSFSIGIRGIQVAQTAMEIISHNIANVNTEGFSRQRLNLSTTVPFPSRFGPLGSGVDGDNIVRMHDEFITRNLADKSSLLAKYEAQKISMDSLESIFNEASGNGINEALSEFWTAWQDIANNPEGNPERTNLLEKTTTLTTAINLMRSDMDALKTDLDRRLNEAVVQANALIEEIAAINSNIVSSEAGQLQQANDLRDQRDKLLGELSEFMDINYFEDPANGSVFVMTSKGTPLVEEHTFWSIAAVSDQAGSIHINWERGNGGEVDITESISNGKIGGWLELRDEMLDSFYDQFDAFTQGLIKEVNRQHTQGVGLNRFNDLTSTYDISSYARYETELDGENNDIVFTALTPDEAGDNIRIEYVNPGVPSSPLSVAAATDPLTGIKTITVTLATNAANRIVTRAEDIVEAVNSHATAGTWVEAALANDNNGEGVVSEITPPVFLNRNLSNLLEFGEEIESGSFDLIVYDSQGNPMVTSILVNPDDTREDIIDQINNTDHLTAMIQVETGGNYIRIQSDPGYDFAFANDTSGALLALGLNTFFEGYDTQTIKINDLIENDPTLIAAGRVDENGLIQTGDNTNALDIADLQDRKFSFPGLEGTISDAYNTLAADIGASAHAITSRHDFNVTLVDQLQALQDQVSAVSLDEEMTELMKFQYAFQAAAKIISVSDELLQTILDMK